MTPSLKPALLNLLSAGAVDRVARRLGGRGAVLAYHGVVGVDAPSGPLHLTPTRFEEQLGVMLERRFAFLDLAEFIDRLRLGRSVRGCLVVTFDDAYAGVGSVVPLLARLDIPATIFVPSGSVGGAGYWWDRLEGVFAGPEAGLHRLAAFLGCGWTDRADLFQRVREHILGTGGILRGALAELVTELEAGIPATPTDDLRPMGWAELAEWTRWEGGTCAVHTVHHPVLPRLLPAEQAAEIADCYAHLQEHFPVTSVLAYPYGLYDASTIVAAGEAGMTAAVTMDGYGVRSGEDPLLAIPRIPFGDRTRPARLGLHLTGAVRAYRRRQSFENGYPRIPLPPAD